MTDRHDRQQTPWADAEVPTPDELARTERELAALGTPPPLPAAKIEAWVARATAMAPAPTATPRDQFRRQRRLAAAGLFVLLTGSAAWVTIRLWPSGTHSVQQLGYATAIAIVDEPNQDDARLLSAIGILDEHCAEVFAALRRIEGNEGTTPLAATARDLRAEFASILDRGAARAPRRVDDTWDAVFAETTDRTLPIDQRRAALQRLAHLTREGLVAIRAARLRSDEMQRRRQHFVAALRAELR